MTRSRLAQHTDGVEAGVIVNDWMTDAACIDRLALPWLEDHPSDAEKRAMALACGVCPVRPECAEYVRAADVTAGFWAGRNRTRTSAGGDLRHLLAQRDATAAKAAAIRAGEVG